MPDHPPAPDWCRPGAELVVVATHRRELMVMHTVHVTRITKTQVIVERRWFDDSATETRFRIQPDGRRPRLRVKDRWDVVDRELAPLDAPDVVAAYRRADMQAAAGKVEELALRFRRDRDLDAARSIAEELVKAGVIASFTLPQHEETST